MADSIQPQNTAPSPGQSDQAQGGLVEKTKAYLQQNNMAGAGPAMASQAQPGMNTTQPPVQLVGQNQPQYQQTNNNPQIQPQSQPTAAQKSKSVSVKGMTNVADALFAKGMINEDQLKSIKFEAITNNTTPIKLLIDQKIVSSSQIQEIRAEMFGLGYIDLSSITIPAETLNRIPKEIAIKNKTVAFEETNNRVKVAMVDPLDLQKVKFLESMLGKRVDTYYATQEAVKEIIDTKYGAQIGNVVDKALEDIGVVDIKENVGDLDQGAIEGAPVAKIVNMILDYAIKHSASDIHIEPRETRLAVRFRVHGILAEKLSLPAKLANSIVARIKILSNLKIDEHRMPQDGRFQVKTEEKAIDLRVSVMPSIYGEKIVMRLLEKNQKLVDINKVGMRGAGLKIYKEALSKTQGIILITGPTGSGKTVTLASSLGVLNNQEVNILTLEDPVEIRIDGITQVQVNANVGLTFASGLRAFLRQDPDIIMVGEIRDAETANLAVQAALTGHLVLATLHTNSAAGAVTRLMDIGIAPYLISSTVNVVVGQRLVRRLDPESRQPYNPAPHILEMMHKELDKLNGFDLIVNNQGQQQQIHFDQATQNVTLYKPGKTPHNDTGYAGRTGIFEIMRMSDTLSKMVMERASTRELHKKAVEEGMITMAQDGFMKAMEGVTTIEEVLRVQTN